MGLAILLLYYSALRQQQLTGYEVAALALVTLAALGFDYLKLGQFLTAYRARKAAGCAHDPALQAALLATVRSPRLAKLLETELLTLYYAFFAKFEPGGDVNNDTRFSYTRSSNAHDVFLFVALSQLPFLPFIHVFLEYAKGPGPAWAVSFLTLWSVVWYLAQVEAARLRPIELTDAHLKYRFGLIWTAEIPLGEIRRARSIDASEVLVGDGLFLSPLGSTRNVLLEFEAPVRFSGPWLLERRAKKAAISLDNPSHFLEQLTLRGILATGRQNFGS
ncbi:MAG: hypothetical protein QNJ00_09050 [Woeseiaceae bacterium]|nr:hypothetical protein [Woeseiaceae bacterium]